MQSVLFGYVGGKSGMRKISETFVWLLIGLACPVSSMATELNEASEVLMTAPTWDDWKATYNRKLVRRKKPLRGFNRLLTATGFKVRVYKKIVSPKRVVGYLRRGTVVSARKVPKSRSCKLFGTKGSWYRIEGKSYVCSADNVSISRHPIALSPPQIVPALQKPLPYKYARVTKQASPLFEYQPNGQILDVVISQKKPVVGLKEFMNGVFFLSLSEEHEVSGRDMFRTVHGNYVLSEDLQHRDSPTLVGEKLSDSQKLPLAFVHQEDANVYCRVKTKLKVCGIAKKFARFGFKSIVRIQDKDYVLSPQDYLIPYEAVRIARSIDRPSQVSPRRKWVHIDLQQQTLVAYFGDDPVFATLVSTGKETHATPTGLFRVQRKYVAKTMRGNDPVEGIYHIEDIPWVMYYDRTYAVHGAYWHDTFGNTRSHGCTNVSPPDGRWLFHWTSTKVPNAWNARLSIDDGTYVYFTQKG